MFKNFHSPVFSILSIINDYCNLRKSFVRVRKKFVFVLHKNE